MERRASSSPMLLAPGASHGGVGRLPGSGETFPPVDERIVAEGAPFEIIDGQILEVMPAEEPHAVVNSRLAYVLEAVVRAPEYRCAVDMLTRANRFSDTAPDASVYPS